MKTKDLEEKLSNFLSNLKNSNNPELIRINYFKLIDYLKEITTSKTKIPKSTKLYVEMVKDQLKNI